MRYFGELGARLIENGYLIVPIKPGSKAPVGNEWQRQRIGLEQHRRMAANGAAECGIGILAGHGVTKVDIDCLDEHIAQAMRAWCEAHLGPTVEIVGRAPKLGLVYRCPEDMRKFVGARYRDAEGRVHGLEAMGVGNQFVAYGVHPDTGREYTQDSFLGSLLDTPAELLPAVTVEQLEAANAEWCRLCEADGWTRAGGEARALAAPAADEDYIPDPPTDLNTEQVRELLSWFPTDADDYHSWVAMGQALHHQYRGDAEGLALWDEWSQQSTKYEAGACEVKWATFGAYHGRPVTLRAYLGRVKPLREAAKRDARDAAFARIQALFAEAATATELLHEAAPAAASLLVDYKDEDTLALRYLRERYQAIVGAPLPQARARRALRPPTAGDGRAWTMTREQSAALQALPLDRDPETQGIRATLGNLHLALTHRKVCGAWLAWDEFLGDLQIATERAECGTPAWRPMDDADLVTLRMRLENAGAGFRPIGRELMRDAVLSACRANVHDSAKVWLNSLPEWDGTPRVDAFLERYCQAEASDYTRAVSRYLWTALAGRVLDPGCQVDMVPVLIGEQGARKTSLVRALVPSPDYYLEVHLGRKDDDLARQLRGKLIAELGELKGMRQREMGDLKAFITRRWEEWVPKFRELSQRYARRCVMVGTNNERQILEDDTGNRRWLPVDVGAILLEEVEKDLEQLWAEGRIMFELGGVDWRDSERLARSVHAEHMVSDAWDEPIMAWLDGTDSLDDAGPKRADDPHGVTLHDVMRGALGLGNHQIDRKAELRVGRILRGLSYERASVRVGGKVSKRWIKRNPSKE